MVVMGVKMVYVPWMPGHRKRLTQTYVHTNKKKQCFYVQLFPALIAMLEFSSLSLSHSLSSLPPTHSMVQLIKPSADKEYVDLTVSFASADGEGEDSPGPPVRYYFK